MAWQIMKRFDPEGADLWAGKDAHNRLVYAVTRRVGKMRVEPSGRGLYSMQAALAQFDAEKRNVEKEES